MPPYTSGGSVAIRNADFNSKCMSIQAVSTKRYSPLSTSLVIQVGKVEVPDDRLNRGIAEGDRLPDDALRRRVVQGGSVVGQALQDGHIIGIAHHHPGGFPEVDRKSTRLNSSHVKISYTVFC